MGGRGSETAASGGLGKASGPRTSTEAGWLHSELWIGASLVAQLVKNLPAMWETLVVSWVRKICWRRDRLPTPVFLGFHCGSAGNESAYNAGDLGLTPGLGRSPGEGKGYPLQYSGLENFTDSITRGVAKSWTWLSDFHFFHSIQLDYYNTFIYPLCRLEKSAGSSLCCMRVLVGTLWILFCGKHVQTFEMIYT